MKLPFQPLALQVPVDRVDPIGNDERRALAALGEEVAHRSVERTRHPHALALPRHERERAVDLADCVGGTMQDARAGLLDGHVAQAVGCRIDEIDELLDIFVHGRRVELRRITGAAGVDRDAESLRCQTRFATKMPAARKAMRNGLAGVGAPVGPVTGPAFASIRPFSITCPAASRILRGDCLPPPQPHLAPPPPRSGAHRMPTRSSHLETDLSRARASSSSAHAMRKHARRLKVVEPHSLY